MQQAEDQDLQQNVTEHGTVPVHSAWRTGITGRKFCISNGILWNIETPTGQSLRGMLHCGKLCISKQTMESVNIFIGQLDHSVLGSVEIGFGIDL